MTLTPLNARAGPQVSGSKITQSTQNASKTGLREPFGPTQTSKNEKVSIVHVRSGHHTPQTPRRSSSSHDRPQTQHTLRVRLTAQENCSQTPEETPDDAAATRYYGLLFTLSRTPHAVYRTVYTWGDWIWSVDMHMDDGDSTFIFSRKPVTG